MASPIRKSPPRKRRKVVKAIRVKIRRRKRSQVRLLQTVPVNYNRRRLQARVRLQSTLKQDTVKLSIS
jgi:hypothetical protein